MQTPISVDEKKVFVRWFLNKFQLKKRESVWILNYLMNHDSLLSSVHFVNEVKFCPRGMEMSAKGVPDPPFRFYKGQVMTNDAEKSFHDLRMNQDEPVYIQINFENSQQCAKYALVLEENPFLPPDYYLNERDLSDADRLLSHSLLKYRQKVIEEKIDQALIRGKRREFKKLCEELKGIKQELNAFS